MNQNDLNSLIGRPFPIGFEWDLVRGVLTVGYEDESFDFGLVGCGGMRASFVEDYTVRSGVDETHFEVGGLREVIEGVEVTRTADGGFDIELRGKKKSIFIEVEDGCY